jgi:hypothetical protein
VPPPDGFGLVGPEQAAAEKAALKAQLAALTQVKVGELQPSASITFLAVNPATELSCTQQKRWPRSPAESSQDKCVLCCDTPNCFCGLFPQETAQWDELNTQQLALTPERPPAAATGLPAAAADLPAAAVAAAREEAHQQLTLQVGLLCVICVAFTHGSSIDYLVEGVAELLVCAH